MDVRDALTKDLDPVLLYRILALRSEVFVVEQQCIYHDMDGRDLEADARQLWLEDGSGAVLATLRLIVDRSGTDVTARIGRVATARDARGRGLAGQLMVRALELVGDRASVLGAQSYLVDWYARFGYVATGEEYLDDGIPHVDMARPAPAVGQA